LEVEAAFEATQERVVLFEVTAGVWSEVRPLVEGSGVAVVVGAAGIQGEVSRGVIMSPDAAGVSVQAVGILSESP